MHSFLFRYKTDDSYATKQEAELGIIFQDDMTTEKLFEFFGHFLADIGHPAGKKIIEEMEEKSSH